MVVFSEIFRRVYPAIPILALYMARTYKDVAARPLYFIDKDNSFLD